MKEFEEIVKKEKDKTYVMKNRDLFAFYTLTLINQEASRRRHKRNLILSGIIVMVFVFFSLPNIESLFNSYVNFLNIDFLPLIYNPDNFYLISLWVIGVSVLFRNLSKY